MVVHPLAARVVGQASRRGLIPRVPTGDRLLADVETWLTTNHPDLVRSTQRSTPAEGDARLDVSLHPAAPALVLTASETGRVGAEADTVAVGPGYHRLVGRILERMEMDLAVSWGRVDPDRPDEPDQAAAVTFADRAATERAYLGWLGRTLVGARAVRAAGGAGVQVGTPDGVRFTFDGAIATALGPRDDAWLERAVADTRVAIDITPWWADATDAQSMLNRALCLMWFEVRWRPPALKPEGLVLDEVHRLLSRAFPLDPALSYPWRAWAEVVGLRSISDPMARQVVARAMRESTDGVEIGYRRAPVTISHEGWALTIPGSFAEKRTTEEWWGGGAGRAITLAAVPTGTAAGAMAAQSFIDQFAGNMGPDAIDHRAGGVMGRAMLSSDASSGVEVGVLEGYSAVVGSGAAIRIVFDDPADWQWAIDMWRSLAPG
ncbi:MAG: hypothetical protein A2Z32_10555 [Chloroflexi bacterium RBG_16_69_14]|nr:MAG: hypothetical protein A2Z32_10555 [Chloroflexi bacterium RBG_16_69_14]